MLRKKKKKEKWCNIKVIKADEGFIIKATKGDESFHFAVDDFTAIIVKLLEMEKDGIAISTTI